MSWRAGLHLAHGGDSRTKSVINKMPSKSEKAFTKLTLTLCLITYKASRVLNVNAFPWEAQEAWPDHKVNGKR